MSRCHPHSTFQNRYILITIISALITFTTAACTTYIPATGLLAGAPNDQYYTSSATVSHVVSAVVNCSGSALGVDASLSGVDVSGNLRCNATQCGLSVPPYYLVNVDAELNISTSAEQKKDILALVKRNSSQIAGNALLDFNSTVTVNVAGATCIPEGTLRWWSFTPTLVCAEGTLMGCTGSDSPSDGTGIRACGIQYFAIGRNGLGNPSSGPNVVIGSGIEPRPAPANATIIDNKNNVSGAAMLIPGVWNWLVVIALLSFSVL